MLQGPTGSADATPPMVRRLGYALVAVLAAGALYLIVVRGEAIVLDLSGLAGRLWCF